MKTIKYLILLFIGASAIPSFAKTQATAVCRIENADTTEIFHMFDSLGDSQVIIQTQKGGEIISEEIFPASVRSSLWTGSYHGHFTRNGASTYFYISYDVSPSVGSIGSNYPMKDMQCELPGIQNDSDVNVECNSNHDCPAGYYCKIIWSPDPFRCERRPR